MKRLINGKVKTLKQLIEFNNNIKILNNSEFMKVGKKLIESKIKLLALKLDPIDAYMLQEECQELADYQFSGESGDKLDLEVFKLIQEISINYSLPCLYNGVAYRGLYIDIDKIDIDNIEKSIRNVIRTNEVDGFSKDKSFVDNIENQNINGKYIPNENIPVKIKMDIKNGIYLNLFWKELKQTYIDSFINDKKNGEELFKEDFNEVDNLFKNEEEISVILTNDYEIYNLNEIKQILKNNEE